jgi:hypothetical protein
MNIYDPFNIGLLYIKSGSFVITLRSIAAQKTNSLWSEADKEVFMSEGQYVDDERILKDFGMVLVSLQCTSSTG